MRFELNEIFIEEGLLLAIVKYTYFVAILIPINIYGIIIFTAIIGFFKTDIQNKLIFTLLCLAVYIMTLSSDFRMHFVLFPFLIMLGIKPINELVEANIFEDKRILLVFSILLLIWIVITPENFAPANWVLIRLKYTYFLSFILGIIFVIPYLLIKNFLKNRSTLTRMPKVFK